jgi:hypothetical protein
MRSAGCFILKTPSRNPVLAAQLWTNFVASTQRIFSGKKTQSLNKTGLSLLTHTATDEREIQFGLKFIY